MKKKDVLNRDPFIENVMEVIETISSRPQGCCFCINGNWGSGKTFVINQIENRLAIIQSEETNDNKYIVFHYDCWKYDYYEEPLIAIVAALNDFIISSNSIFNKNENVYTDAVIKKVKETIGTIAGEICKNKIGIDLVDVVKGIKDDADNEIEKKQSFDELYDFKQSLDFIREEIGKLAESKTVIIFIDELDRCLPTYAIKVLERVHHLFSDLNNVIVVITMDKKQLEHSIKQIYGEIDVDTYLRKFISFKLDLDNGMARRYCEKYERYFKKFEYIENDMVDIEKFFGEIFENIDIRTQEKIFYKAELVHDMCISEKVDFSILMFEILFLVVGIKMKTFNIEWLGKIFSATFTIPETQLGKKYYQMLNEYEKKGRSINTIENNRYHIITENPYGRMFFWIAKVFDEGLRNDGSEYYYCPDLCKRNNEMKVIMKFSNLIQVINCD